MSCNIDLLWNPDAGVWVATSKDVPGLVLESESFDALLERVRHTIPELLELNDSAAPYYDLSFASKRQERMVAKIGKRG